MLKINYGSGRQNIAGYKNLDFKQVKDGNGKNVVDYVVNVECEKLPFKDNAVDEVLADNVLEHLGDGFIYALNELHRVIKVDGILEGVVPVANSEPDLQDITHKRKFIKKSFSYLTGTGGAFPNRPAHPKYADYGVLPWVLLELNQVEDLIHFKLSPRKV